MAWAIAVQETQAVTFDMRHMWDGPGWNYRIFLFMTFAFLVMGIVLVIHYWWKVGFRARKTRQVLDQLSSHLQDRDFAAVSALAGHFSFSPLYSGLCGWAGSPPSRSAFLHVLRLSGAQFRRALFQLRRSTRALTTMLGLTVLMYLAALSVEIPHFLDMYLDQKLASARWVVLWAHQNQVPFLWAVWVLLILFICYRHLKERLETIESDWDYFYLRAEALLASPSSKDDE